jgi:heavy metal sensor kinase
VIRLSLRARLAIWFAASLLLILAPVMATLAALQWRSMRAALDHHLAEDLEVAAEMLVIGPSGLQWRTEATVDLGYDAGPQRWVEVYTRSGEPVYARGLAARPEIRNALPTPGPATAGYRTLRTPAGAFTRALTAERRVSGAPVWMRVVRSEDELRADLRWLIVVFSVLAPVAVLGAAVAGYLISGRALSPLSRMAERARSISADRLSERLPVENPSDELGQLATVFNDTFARLEASFERLKRFTADASHQLRTPLTAIRSVGEVGLREARRPLDYEEVIGSMLEETDRLSSLVDALLTLSRWESGRVPRTPVTFDLGEVARDVATQLAVLAEDRDITVDVAIDHALSVSADADMVRSAVMNVVDNAIKFTPEGGRVRVWGHSDASSHHLVVDDSGPGIPPEHRERVLERFHRVEGCPAGRAAPPGAGLGLAIADWAFTANHGRVAIDASDAGGARVVMSLPRLDPSSPA